MSLLTSSQKATLDQLRPLHFPDPPSDWPPAIGIVILGLFALSLLAFITWISIKRFRSARKPLAMMLVEEIHKSVDLGGIKNAELNKLMKVFALAKFETEQVANISEEAWLDFIMSSSSNLNRAYLEPVVHHYQLKSQDLASDQSVATVIEWIRQNQMASLNWRMSS